MMVVLIVVFEVLHSVPCEIKTTAVPECGTFHRPLSSFPLISTSSNTYVDKTDNVNAEQDSFQECRSRRKHFGCHQNTLERLGNV